jgi:hypothetical protein
VFERVVTHGATGHLRSNGEAAVVSRLAPVRPQVAGGAGSA